MHHVYLKNLMPIGVMVSTCKHNTYIEHTLSIYIYIYIYILRRIIATYDICIYIINIHIDVDSFHELASPLTGRPFAYCFAIFSPHISYAACVRFTSLNQVVILSSNPLPQTWLQKDSSAQSVFPQVTNAVLSSLTGTCFSKGSEKKQLNAIGFCRPHQKFRSFVCEIP